MKTQMRKFSKLTKSLLVLKLERILNGKFEGKANQLLKGIKRGSH